jgi:hypothetical protein
VLSFGKQFNVICAIDLLRNDPDFILNWELCRGKRDHDWTCKRMLDQDRATFYESWPLKGQRCFLFFGEIRVCIYSYYVPIYLKRDIYTTHI